MTKKLPDLKTIVEERVNILRKIPEDDCIKSNCHGTVLYLLGFKDGRLPGLVYEKEMFEFFKNHCRIAEQPKETDIVTIWENVDYQSKDYTNSTLWHSAILVHPNSERIYHQRGTGDVFEFSTINRYLIENFPRLAIKRGLVFPIFYRFEG